MGIHDCVSCLTFQFFPIRLRVVFSISTCLSVIPVFNIVEYSNDMDTGRYNRVNGIHVSEDRFLLKKILRDEWKFDGLVCNTSLALLPSYHNIYFKFRMNEMSGYERLVRLLSIPKQLHYIFLITRFSIGLECTAFLTP